MRSERSGTHNAAFLHAEGEAADRGWKRRRRGVQEDGREVGAWVRAAVESVPAGCLGDV